MAEKKKALVILTGAGISAESGIQTFRDSGGLWEGHDVMQVATPEGWQENPELVQKFYSLRRKDAAKAQPNAAHLGLKKLEEKFAVYVITQNVDDLHERAGSTNVMHLHGMLREVRSTKDPNLIYDVEDQEVMMGDLCELGSQLRPNVVWFGEPVPMIEKANILAEAADIFVVIGTSLVVYPAAGLIHFVGREVPKYIIDPNTPDAGGAVQNLTYIPENATVGIEILLEKLMAEDV